MNPHSEQNQSYTGYKSFRGEVCSFGGDGSFHEEDQADQRERNNGEDKERIEVGERRGLLCSQIVEDLQCHLFGRYRIVGLLARHSVPEAVLLLLRRQSQGERVTRVQ